MADLRRRVSGDWIEIREAAKDYETLDGYFRVSPAQLRIQIEKLDYAVEHGIVEYKKTSLNPLFGVMEGARFKSPSQEELERQIEYVSAMLFVMLIQRQFAQGVLKPIRDRREGQTISPQDLDLKEILKDINTRVRKDPGFSSDQAVKNILLQTGQLKKERENLQKLLPTIKQESRETFLGNYRKRFADIINKIKRSYATILQRELPQVAESRPVLQVVDMEQVVPTLTAQCEAVYRLRSTLSRVCRSSAHPHGFTFRGYRFSKKRHGR